METPRDLLLAVRGELRALTGHWAQGFTSGGEPLVKHDRRMPDGSCLDCALLEQLDALLYVPEPEPEAKALVLDLVTPRRRAQTTRPPGMPLGRRH